MATKEYSCVRKTKKSFETSLAELSKEYPFNKITVKMLCEKAELSRNAFYFHYKDINDLAREIEDGIINEAVSHLEGFRKLGFPENVLATIEAFIDLFDERRDTVLMLFDKSYSVSFTIRLGKILSDFNYEYFKQYHPKADRSNYDVFYTFLSSGYYGCLRLWLENPELISKENLIKMMYVMVKRLLVLDDPDIGRIVGTANNK